MWTNKIVILDGDNRAFDKWFWRAIAMAGLTAIAGEGGVLLVQELRRKLKKSRKKGSKDEQGTK